MAREANRREFEAFQQRLAAIKEAWRDFVHHDVEPPVTVIEPDVLASWRRSKAHGLDPNNIYLTQIEPGELRERQRRCAGLIRATAPLFDVFANEMGGDMFTLDLYDEDLILIKTFGTDEIARQRKEYARLGTPKEEAIAGTTAMSVSKATGRACQLVGAEHFDVNIHERICTAVPIFFPNDRFLGVINMVENCELSAKHTLRVMIALGKGVEYNLLQTQKQKQLEASDDFNRAILEEIDNMIVVVDAEAVVKMVNKAVLDDPDFGRETLVGRRTAALFGEGNPFDRVLRERRVIDHKEIVLPFGGAAKRFVATIKPILSDAGAVRGVIGTLSNLGTTTKLMRNIGGWQANLTFDDVVGRNATLRQVVLLARQTAGIPSNTLILGESGTGKEVFAQSIHNASPLSGGPFVAVNCAAIPISLLESELFGYESGAFTGAKKSGSPGKFELAEGGTIFLDEINSMPLDVQAKLLRVLQDKTVTRIGGTSSISLNLKIIAASNVNLWDMVNKGLFRADLFYRLNIITIQIPPLRDRPDDIPLLVDNILGRISQNFSAEVTVTGPAMDMLVAYAWPGNVRELENILERAYVQASISGGAVIDRQQLQTVHDFTAGGVLAGVWPAVGAAPLRMPASTDSPADSASPLKSSEKAVILDSFARNRWNITRTAKALQISRNTLYKKMRQHGIAVPE